MQLASTVLSLLCLMSAALWNGYPIVYSDTSAYLASGFHLDTLIDRPITYGLFIRVCSLNGWSLWTVVIAQSLLLAHVMGLTLRSVGIHNVWARCGIIAATSIATGLPFVCGQIITDVFTPILLFTLFLLLFIDDLSKGTRVRLFALFLLAFAMHMSHIAITALLLVFALMLRWRMKPSSAARPFWPTIGMLVAISIAGTLVMGSALAKSKNTFFAARMAENGILQRYLDEHCGTEHFRLCERRGSIPNTADAFLWAEDTPLKLYADRKEMEDELGRIASGSFHDPALLGMHVRSALSSIGQQLIRFAVGDGNGDFHEGTKLHERIGLFIPSERNAFDATRQMDNKRFQEPLITINRIQFIIMWLGLLAIITLCAFRWTALRSIPHILLFAVFLLFGYFMNTAVNASLVMVADRFGTKLAWVVPFIAIALFVALRDRQHRPSSLPAQ